MALPTRWTWVWASSRNWWWTGQPSMLHAVHGQITKSWPLLLLLLSRFSRVRLCVTPWTATFQASLPITNSWSLFKLVSIESVMPSNHLILCTPLLLPLSIFPSIRFFSNESFLASGGQSIGVSVSASVLPMNIQDWFPLGWTGLISLQSRGFSRVFSSATIWKHQFFDAQPHYGPTLTSVNDYWKTIALTRLTSQSRLD